MALEKCRECSKPVSTEATSCPHCGTPEPTRQPPPPARSRPPDRGLGKIIALVAFIIVGLIALSLWADSSQQAQADREAAEREAETEARAQAIIDRPDTATEAAVLFTEEHVRKGGHERPHDALHRRYIEIQLARLKAAAASGRAARAGVAAIRTIDTVYTAAQRRQFARDTAIVHRVQRRETREAIAAEHQQKIETRRAYAAVLENSFLDMGMDAHVSVSGSEATALKMEFILFSRVWAHKFQQGEHWGVLRQLGFRRVVMTDGYDFTWEWTL